MANEEHLDNATPHTDTEILHHVSHIKIEARNSIYLQGNVFMMQQTRVSVFVVVTEHKLPGGTSGHASGHD